MPQQARVVIQQPPREQDARQTVRRAYGSKHTCFVGSAALATFRIRGSPDSAGAGDRARQRAAHANAGQFTDGPRYPVEGIGMHGGTALAPGSDPVEHPR